MGQEVGRSECSWPSAQQDLLQPLIPAWGLHSPDSTHITIFLQTRYLRESRYLQMSMSMPGWMGSGSIVQKRLGKEKWAWGAGPGPGVLGLTGSAGNRIPCLRPTFPGCLTQDKPTVGSDGRRTRSQLGSSHPSGFSTRALPALTGININRRFSDKVSLRVSRNDTYTSAHRMSESEGTLGAP